MAVSEGYPTKFVLFSDDELYMLKRALIESSGEIALNGLYNKKEIDTAGRLLNEAVDEIKGRESSRLKQAVS